MKLPPLLETSIKQLLQQRVAEVQLVSQTAQLKAGRILAALVTEISALTEAERQQVLRRLQQQITAPQTPKIPGDVSDAKIQLSEWLKQPQLNLVGLRAGSQQLYALTPEALTLQQAVKVLVRQDGQLQLLNQKAAEALLRPTQPASGTKTPAAYSQPQVQPQPKIHPTQVQTIAASLRTSLPQQSSLKNLLQVLAKVEAELAPLPAQVRKNLLPPDVTQALNRVRAQSHTPEQLSKPEGLRQAIKQSGTLLEGKLATQLNPSKTSFPIPGKEMSRAGLPETRTTHAPGKPGAQPATASLLAGARQTASTRPIAEVGKPLAETDTKAALLHTLQTLQPHIKAGQTMVPKPISASEKLIFSLLGLLKKIPVGDKRFAESKGQLLQNLQQQISAALAKIQTQQLQTLSQRLGDAGAASQGGYFELPVRLTDGYSSIGLHIHEYWRRETAEDGSQDNNPRRHEKVHQWEVLLEFDLDDYGQLTSQLKVADSTVSANFWAENDRTRALASQQLSALREQMQASGLEVKDMQCLTGPPPQQNLKLDYNLVDITT